MTSTDFRSVYRIVKVVRCLSNQFIWLIPYQCNNPEKHKQDIMVKLALLMLYSL